MVNCDATKIVVIGGRELVVRTQKSTSLFSHTQKMKMSVFIEESGFIEPLNSYLIFT